MPQTDETSKMGLTGTVGRAFEGDDNMDIRDEAGAHTIDSDHGQCEGLVRCKSGQNVAQFASTTSTK